MDRFLYWLQLHQPEELPLKYFQHVGLTIQLIIDAMKDVGGGAVVCNWQVLRCFDEHYIVEIVVGLELLQIANGVHRS